MIAEIVALEITNAATDNAPMYINVTHVKKRAKKPPAAAKDTRRDEGCIHKEKHKDKQSCQR
jgi:hypothetical protein